METATTIVIITVLSIIFLWTLKNIVFFVKDYLWNVDTLVGISLFLSAALPIYLLVTEQTGQLSVLFIGLSITIGPYCLWADDNKYKISNFQKELSTFIFINFLVFSIFTAMAIYAWGSAEADKEARKQRQAHSHEICTKQH